MREKLLSRIEDELLRLRHDVGRSARDRSGPVGFGIDGALVSGLTDGTLTPQQERELAGQVARLLPYHWAQSNSSAEAMSQVTDFLGGQRELAVWLDRFPGFPRLAARLYVFMGLLDRLSETSAVVTALREDRERTPYPPGLRGYLVPETDDETVAGISFRIEEHLSDGETDKAVDLALAMADWLRRAAPRAQEIDPGLHDLGELMDHSHQDLQDAAAELHPA
ncbi:hypothetical protein ACIQ6V_19785 [Streptomyces sp. NPDC096198]|uniref:hypothetical protein n=1 Tax=Streptomyces sp. NPDC096198 TaxID=3366080 RepID=UPI00380460BC